MFIPVELRKGFLRALVVEQQRNPYPQGKKNLEFNLPEYFKDQMKLTRILAHVLIAELK